MGGEEPAISSPAGRDFEVPFPALNSWVRAAARCDFDIEPLFRRYGVCTDLSQLADFRIRLSAVDALMQACTAAARELHFPFVLGDSFTFDFMPELETYLSTSASLRDATLALGWIREALNPYMDFRLQVSGPVARLLLAPPPQELPPTRPYNSESGFAAVLRFVRLLLPAQVVNASTRLLRFRHPPPTYADAYEPFFGLPVAFNQPMDALEFDRELLDRRLHGGFPGLHRQAASLVQQHLQRNRQRRGIAAQVHGLLSSPHESIDTVAAKLALHPRTLQRRLRQAGTRFAQLQADAGFHRAVRLMREGHHLDDIAERLGFSDRRSFTRAFKRWSGMTPSVFRKNLDT